MTGAWHCSAGSGCAATGKHGALRARRDAARKIVGASSVLQTGAPVPVCTRLRFLCFIEAGAGSILTGLLRGIDPTLSGVKFGEPEDLERVLNV